MSYKKLGNYIQQVNNRNRDLQVDTLLGVSITKKLIPSIANTVGTDMSTYKIIEKGQFAYGTITSRNGDKISIALADEYDKALVSQIYIVFEVIDTNELLPEYLMMWFSRPEFDRYARYHSHGSTRESFDWEDLCEVELPVPSIEKQREIVAQYQTVENKIKVNEQICEKLEATAQTLYKQWFVDFEFPNEEGKPYKFSGGAMVFNEELERKIPEGWEVVKLSDLSKLITKGTTPENVYTKYNSELIPYIKIQSISKNNFVNPLKLEFIAKTTHVELKRSQIFANDILFSITGTLGEFALATKNITPANTNQNIAIIRIDEKIIFGKFIYWLLMCGWHNEYINKNKQEAVQANLNLDMIGKILILKPDSYFLSEILKIINLIIEFQFNSFMEITSLSKLSKLILANLSKTQSNK